MECGVIYHLRHLRCLASFLLFSPNSFTASPSGSCPTSCQMRLHFLASFPSSPPALPPALNASHWQTAVDHKMVDQVLFPAHPNWRWLSEQLNWSHFLLETLENPTATLFPLVERPLIAPLIHARINKGWMLQGEIPVVMRSSSLLLLMNFSPLLTWKCAIMCDS